MAILGNIRKRTGLTIVVIGFAMVAFLVVDAFSGNSTLFGGADPNNLGKINGEKVTLGEYQNLQRMSSGSNLPENQVHTQAWNQLIRNKIIKEHAGELGFEFPPFQAEAIAFGQETPEDAENMIAEMKAAAEAGNQQANAQYQGWLNFQDEFRTTVLGQQYTNFISAGAQATKKDAEILAKNTGSTATIEYAFVSYQDLGSKNEIEVTDDEIKAYIKKYPKKYQRSGLVNLHYVNFPAQPSAEDDSAAFNYVQKFKTTQYPDGEITDTIQSFASVNNDSIANYLSFYSDEQLNPTFQSYQSFAGNKELQTFVNSAATGSVKGPYKQGNAYMLSKLLEKKVIDSARTSHILIRFVEDSLADSQPEVRTKTVAKALADSINTVVQSDPNQFASLVQKYSEDTGSAQRGGNVGWMTEESSFVEPYKNYGLTNPANSIGVVESQFGYHIIKVDERKSGTGYKVANLSKKVELSEKTQESIFNEANNFFTEVQGKSLNDFANLAREKDFAYNNSENIERFAPQIGYLGTDQDSKILAWAFNEDNKPGALEKFPTSNGGHVVVYLQNRFDEGLANPASIRKEVEPILKAQKLYDLLNDKSANITMDQFVSEYGATKANATVSFEQATLGDKGPEPAVVGAAFGLKQNQTSKLIKGNGGLYIITNLAKTIGTAQGDMKAQVDQLNTQYQNLVRGRLMQSLVNQAEVKDNRSKFFTQEGKLTQK